MRALAAAFAFAASAIVVGMLGAWAFNPDDGEVAHIEALWRVFGVAVYLGVLALLVLSLTTAVLGAARVVEACRRRHAL